MNVSQMLALPSFKGAHVIAGSSGLSREVDTAMIIEAPDIEKWGRSGQLLITSFYAFADLSDDGLADFFDGFGGGHDRESRLRIMKDSHIGSYGVIGLIAYFLLYVSLLYSLPPGSWAASILAADVLSKLMTAAMIDSLPYARTEETSKTKVLYNRLNYVRFNLITAGCAVVLYFLGSSFWGLLPALLVSLGLRFYFKRKINGYTGDCCGAAVLLTEQAYYLGTVIAFNL